MNMIGKKYVFRHTKRNETNTKTIAFTIMKK